MTCLFPFSEGTVKIATGGRDFCKVAHYGQSEANCSSKLKNIWPYHHVSHCPTVSQCAHCAASHTLLETQRKTLVNLVICLIKHCDLKLLTHNDSIIHLHHHCQNHYDEKSALFKDGYSCTISHVLS